MGENICSPDDDNCELCGEVILYNPNDDLCDMTYLIKNFQPGTQWLWTCLSCCISNRELASESSEQDIKKFLGE